METTTPTSFIPSATLALKTTITPVISLPGDYDLINEKDQARMVSIPGTRFSMGIGPTIGLEKCRELGEICDPSDFADESPPHIVELYGFAIYQFEVTNAQYRLCVEAGGCKLPAFTEFYNNIRFAQHPVVFVSWYGANDYCTWAGGRLPTEAEWELAARGTDGRLFPWGDDTRCGYGNYAGCTEGLTAEVGSFAEGQSLFGLFDMAGNVTEWVGDWYDAGYYAHSPEVNPAGPEEGEMRVARGGSWKNPIWGTRVTNRVANFPEVSSSGTGFRCVIPEGN